jgi:threonine/homoserine/homoserine lactone efflux protein
MLNFLASGTILGLSAGFAPGPLLTLVIAETLRHDMKAGIKVALAPILTDLPIILFTLFILTKLSHFDFILGAVSILGGLVVFWLGYESIRTKGVHVAINEIQCRSFRKGVIVNLLNPHPYLFWFSVGGPIMMKALDHDSMGAGIFIASFYLFLVGSKVLLAVIVGRSRDFLTGKIYVYIMRLLGVLLWVFALMLFYEGIRFFQQI